MRVDLPAPFSPHSACTSPRRTRRWMSSFATTPGNRLVIPTSSTAYSPPAVPDSAMPPPAPFVLPGVGTAAARGPDARARYCETPPEPHRGAVWPPGPYPYGDV